MPARGTPVQPPLALRRATSYLLEAPGPTVRPLIWHCCMPLRGGQFCYGEP
jgi:hypothetical protein